MSFVHHYKRALTALALAATLLGAAPSTSIVHADPVAYPVANILCRFSDRPDTYGKTAADYQAMFGTPGLNEYFQEQSYGRINLNGSRTFGWYSLPGTLASYTPHQNIFQDHPLLAQACTAAAEADVEFTAFRAINLFFNDDNVGSFANQALQQTHDGVTRPWPTTFIGGNMSTSPSLVAHEMGHTFGMGHASDGDWDPMAAAALYQPLGPGYIAPHRDVAGWIAANRKLDLSVRHSGYLSQLTQPNANDMLVAYYSLPNGDKYSFEYRRKVGYDSSLPDGGVLIYRVSPGQSPDATLQSAGGGTGNEAVLWRPNETFYDAVNHVKVKVATVDDGRAFLKRTNGTLPNPPSNVRLVSHTNTSMSFAWNDNAADESSILVRWRPAGSTGTWQFAKLPANNTTYTASGLQSATSYDVTVQTCDGGIDDCGAEATATLGTSGPLAPAPTNVHAEQVTATSLTVRWVDNASNESRYELSWGDSSGGSCNVANVYRLDPNTTSYSLTGLQPNHQYCGWVTVFNGAGSSLSWP